MTDRYTLKPKPMNVMTGFHGEHVQYAWKYFGVDLTLPRPKFIMFGGQLVNTRYIVTVGDDDCGRIWLVLRDDHEVQMFASPDEFKTTLEALRIILIGKC